MDGERIFIAGILIASVIMLLERLIRIAVVKKEICKFLSDINSCIRLADDNGFDSLYYYGVAFGYSVSLYGRGLITEHDFYLLKNLIADSREKRCEISIDKIKGVKK